MNPVDHPHGGGEGKKIRKEELLGESLLKGNTSRSKNKLIIK
jgi:ribosomal protein L2